MKSTAVLLRYSIQLCAGILFEHVSGSAHALTGALLPDSGNQFKKTRACCLARAGGPDRIDYQARFNILGFAEIAQGLLYLFIAEVIKPGQNIGRLGQQLYKAFVFF